MEITHSPKVLDDSERTAVRPKSDSCAEGGDARGTRGPQPSHRTFALVRSINASCFKADVGLVDI